MRRICHTPRVISSMANGLDISAASAVVVDANLVSYRLRESNCDFTFLGELILGIREESVAAFLWLLDK